MDNPQNPEVQGSKPTMCCTYIYLQVASEDSDGTGCFQVKIDPRDRKNQDLFIYFYGGGLFPLQTEEIIQPVVQSGFTTWSLQ